MKKYSVFNLVIEVTRRCNMKCKHCLRGDAQDLDISESVYETLFKNIKIINDITFTGGEPSLVVPIITDIRNSLIRNKISVESFYVKTNGLENSKQLAQEVLEWYEFCDSNEVSALDISIDKWHNKVKVPKIFKALSFFKEPDEKEIDSWSNSLINEGNAAKNHLGSRTVKVYPLELEGNNICDTLYLSANGDITTCCDLSYEKIGCCKIGNIRYHPFSKILRNGVKLNGKD